MKNTILKFSLTALAALTLAACGSSGGGDAGSSSQAPTKDKQLSQLKNRIIQVIQHQHLQTIKQVVL